MISVRAELEGFRLSPQQRHIWLAQHTSERLEPAYYAQCAIELEGALNQTALRRAVEAVIARHELLRTVFPCPPGLKVPLQAVLDRQPAAWRMHDLSDSPEPGQAAELEQWFKEARQAPWDFTHGPLLRLTLLKPSRYRHVLLITLPALCADAGTLQNLVRELSRGYAVQGETVSAEPVQYLQFAEWQNALLEDKEAETGKAYWEKVLAGDRELRLACERAATDAPAFTPATFELSVEDKVTAKLAATGEARGGSLDTVLLAVWMILLWRLSGERPFTVAYAHDSRAEYEDLRDILGPCTRSLPVGCDFAAHRSFADVLAQLHTAMRANAEWQDYYVDERREVQTGFEFSASPTRHQGAGLSFSLVKQSVSFDRFKLKLACLARDESLDAAFVYDAHRFRAEDIAVLAEQFETLLGDIAERRDASIRALRVVSAAERQRLLKIFSRGASELVDEHCLHRGFEAQAARCPGEIAVRCGERQLTYARLNSRANQLAHLITRQGLAPGTPIGLCLGRSVEMLVGLLGIWKAGYAYVPLDADNAPARLSHQIAETRMPVLVTEEALLARLPAFGGKIICLDHDRPRQDDEPTTNPHGDLHPSQPAYVIYTSGSTGIPKGVIVTHGNIAHYTHAICKTLGPNSQRQFASVSTLGADLGNTVLFSSLLSGGCLHLLDYEIATDGKKLAAYVARAPVDVLKIVPSHFGALLESCEDRDILPRQYLVFGGEQLTPALLKRVSRMARRHRGELEVVNHYGPTETTVGSVLCNLGRAADCAPDGTAVPLGRPLANTEVYILDPRLELTPLGAPGELYIGGMGVAQGYLEQPGQTAERFIPHPYAGSGNARLYKTGDRARFRPDGLIEFLGRTDDQVKIRGFRIEPGEIEARLTQHAGVRQAAVLAREDNSSNKQLVAYVVRAGGADLQPEALRDFVKASLPDYMAPAAFVFLDALPLTRNGKMDRKALPAPDLSAQLASQYVAPRTPTEETLAAIWAQVLGAKRVGIHDNFFALGGDSIQCIQVASRARQTGLDLSPRHLFQHQTITELATVATSIDQHVDLVDLSVEQVPLPLTPAQRAQLECLSVDWQKAEDIYPLSPMQEGMLYHTLLNPASGIYLMQHRYRLRGSVDHAAFAGAWLRVVDRHPVLRTAFVWDGLERPLQVVHRDVALPVDEFDWRGVPSSEQPERLQAHLHGELDAGFDLTKAPLLRLRLIRLADDIYDVVMSFHHILIDAWCISLVLMDFFHHYQPLIQGTEPRLARARPYRDYIAWLERQDLAAAEVFWRDYLKGFTAATPLVEATNAQMRIESGIADVADSLSKAETQALHKVAQQYQLTVNTLAQGAWALLLSRYCDQREVLFGVTVAGRPTELMGVESMLGLFINSLPLRVLVADNTSLVTWLQAIFAENVRVRQYEYAPLVQIQGWSEVPRGETLFQSLLVYENAPVDPSLNASLREWKVDFSVADAHNRIHTNYPLTVVVTPYDGRLRLRFSYDRRHFSETVIARMLGHYKTLLTAMVTDPRQSVAQLPLLKSAERHRLLVDWNATHALLPRELCVHQLFEAQVAKTPAALAVICEDRKLSYTQLNHQANRIAHALIAQGVGPETPVAVLAERGVALLAMMLGVFKAGGVYLPLDAKHPGARQAQLIDMSRARAVLTTQMFAEQLSQVLQLIERHLPVLEFESCITQSGCENDPPARARPDNLAYVIYTSGSTGTPKGAMVTHAGMLNHVLSKVADLKLTAADVIAQTAAPSFDISVWQFLTALTCGAQVEIIPDETAHDPQRLLQACKGARVTILESVPSLMRAVLDEPAVELTRLRWLLPTGEALTPELARRWLARYPRIPLMNAYGPAECGDDVALCPIVERPAADVVHMPVGRPIANTRLYILNSHLEPCPLGISGELYVAGVGVGRGYLGDPAGSAQAFMPDPFSEIPGARLYKTGDRARYRPDGTIEYLGRLDHQVKIRGYRVEPGEVEARLVQLRDVREAVVIAREDVQGDQRLVAYVVGAQDLMPERLRAHLKRTLPEYMLPAAFVLLAKLPLTPNGKVDRKALPDPEPRELKRAAYVPPHTATEEALCGIWQEVLKVERVGVHDNFFELGGHSLLATQVSSRLRRAFNVTLPLRALFESLTVATLAESVDAACWVRAENTPALAANDTYEEIRL